MTMYWMDVVWVMVAEAQLGSMMVFLLVTLVGVVLGSITATLIAVKSPRVNSDPVKYQVVAVASSITYASVIVLLLPSILVSS